MDERLTTTDLVRGTETADREDMPQNEFIASGGGAAMAREQSNTPLFQQDETERFRNDWNGIQTGFVDEPRKAVEDADHLVASAMKRLAEVFAQEREKLEREWDRGGNISTEDLRVALQRYRSFFNRLLSV